MLLKFIIFYLSMVGFVQAERSVLDKTEGKSLTQQCNGKSNNEFYDVWYPSNNVLEEFDKRVYKLLYSNNRSSKSLKLLETKNYISQYVGIIRNNKKYIYGSFVPASYIVAIPNWKTKAIKVCGEGKDFFSIEMKVNDWNVTYFSRHDQ